jgi:UDP-N-acetylmuramyl pentapeptide phosphotransferase/UDP-N-acetylglucosamine-1-phosphate transferase
MFRAAVFFLAAAISYLVTYWLVKVPVRGKAMDIPNERSSHRQPTPRLGGIGIVTSFMATLPLLWIMVSASAASETAALRFGAALLGYVVVAAIGFIDDVHRIGPLTKYVGQLGATILAISCGVLFSGLTLPFGITLSFGALSIVMTVAWMTGFSNIFYFMDGSDGLAGGVGVIYSLALAAVCFGTDHRLLGAGSLIVGAACLGFLAHNFPPAKIFMGDMGSLFIGYALGAFAVVTTNSGERPAPFIAVLLIFGTFLYDGTFTLLRRLLHGERVFEAHRSHLYQRLVIAGQSHRRVTLTYYALSALLGAGGLVYTFSGDWTRLVILIASGAVLLAFTFYVYYFESAGRAARVYATKWRIEDRG